MVKLTPELQTKLLHFLELGVPIRYACQALNIDESTYFVWMKLGKKKTEGKYFEFFKLVESIPAKAMARKLLHLEQASANGSVTATIWFLEHRYPEIFRQASDLNLNIKPDVTAFIAFLDGAEYKKMREKRKQQGIKSLATTTQSNDAMRQPNTNGVVHMLPPPVKEPIENEPDDLEPVNEEDEECQK